MRFGLFYEHQLPRPWADGDEEQLLADALDQIELADQVGFDAVWEVEHHFLEEYSHSSAPEVFLAAASQRTKHIRLGHGIVQLPVQFNHPARVAERIATLDLVSHGRVEFGTGEASSQTELGGFGVPREAKREQWGEALDVITRMLAEDPFTGHSGPWIDAPPRNVVPKPKQKPHPPLWVACSRRETIELAGRTGIGALSFSFIEPEDAKHWVDSYYHLIKTECVPAGFAVNPNLAVVVPFMCHPDEETAIDRGIDGGHFFGYSLAHYYVFGRHRPGVTNIWDEFEQYRHERGFARDLIRSDSGPLDIKILQGAAGSLRGAIGTPDQIAGLCARYEAVGVDQVIFVAQAGRNRHDHICEAIELFGREVIPRFAEGRDEREAEKAERLAPAIERALARRAAPAGADNANYVVTPTGELNPARTPHFGRGRTMTGGGVRRRVAERVVQNAIGTALRTAPDGLARKVGRSAPAATVYRLGLQQLCRMSDLKSVPDSRIRFALTDGDAVRSWVLKVKEGKATTAPDNGRREVDATLRMDIGDWLGMLGGELDAGELAFEGRLHLEGDEARVMALMSALGLEGNYY
ncbi:MAG: LLM class flavin-dependent oxidoreductase [Acidimicrobiales bacterium]